MREPMNFWEWSDGPGHSDLWTNLVFILASIGLVTILVLVALNIELAVKNWEKRVIEEYEASKNVMDGEK